MFVINRAIARRRMMAEMDEEDHKRRQSAVDPNLLSADTKHNPLRRSSSYKEERRNSSVSEAGRRSSATIARTTDQEDEKEQPQVQIVRFGKPFGKETAFELKLSEQERKSLKMTWKKMNSMSQTSGMGLINVMEKIFEQMIGRQPKIKTFFFKAAFVSNLEKRETITTVRDHAMLLVRLMTVVINDLDNTNRLQIPNCGENHRCLKAFGFRTNMWEMFGETFSDVMFAQECVKAYPHAAKAWIVLISGLTDHMRTGFERRRSARSTSGSRKPEIRKAQSVKQIKTASDQTKPLSKSTSINMPNVEERDQKTEIKNEGDEATE